MKKVFKISAVCLAAGLVLAGCQPRNTVKFGDDVQGGPPNIKKYVLPKTADDRARLVYEILQDVDNDFASLKGREFTKAEYKKTNGRMKEELKGIYKTPSASGQMSRTQLIALYKGMLKEEESKTRWQATKKFKGAEVAMISHQHAKAPGIDRDDLTVRYRVPIQSVEEGRAIIAEYFAAFRTAIASHQNEWIVRDEKYWDDNARKLITVYDQNISTLRRYSNAQNSKQLLDQQYAGKEKAQKVLASPSNVFNVEYTWNSPYIIKGTNVYKPHRIVMGAMNGLETYNTNGIKVNQTPYVIIDFLKMTHRN